MSTQGSDYSQLYRLLAALCDETITDSQASELDDWLARDNEARRHYVEYLDLHCDLQWVSGSRQPSEQLFPRESKQADTQSSSRLPLFGFLDNVLPNNSWIKPMGLLALGLIVVSTSVWLGSKLTPRADVARPISSVEKLHTADSFIATLTAAPGCRWDSSSVPTEAGSRLAAGRLRLVEGDALITFDCGARLLLTGPSVFELQSARQARLLAGQLLAHVPEPAIGFTVLTAAGKVIDLGTEFGLVADGSGASEVHVFDGAVEIYGQTAAKQLLTAGEARRIDSIASTAWQGIELNTDRFLGSGLTAMLQGTVAEPRTIVDDFNDDHLDTNKWRVVTDGIPQGGAAVREQGGRIELINRGHLVTRAKFDPRVEGPLRIRGRWTFKSPKDYLQILTRSNGIPSGSHGETGEGIGFSLFALPSGFEYVALIKERSGGRNVVLTLADYLARTNKNNTVEFEIIDDGKQLTFKVWEPQNKDSALTISCISRLDFAEDFVVFHNRERLPANPVEQLPHFDNVSYLDDVIIETGYRQAIDLSTVGEGH